MSNNNTNSCLSKEVSISPRQSSYWSIWNDKQKHTCPARKPLIGLTPRQDERLAALARFTIMTKGRRRGMWQLFPRRTRCARWGCGPVRQEGSFWHGGEEHVAVCCIKPQWRCQRHPWRHYGNQIAGSDLRLPWRRHAQRWALSPPGRPQGLSARFLLSHAPSLMCLRVSQAKFLILSLWGLVHFSHWANNKLL